MALIIKADMPMCCDRCFYSSRCFTYSQTVQKLLLSEHEQMFDVFGETRLHGCPILGEIPDEHGRLVSADEVQKKMSYYGFHAIDMTIHEFIEDELTTVLEAST